MNNKTDKIWKLNNNITSIPVDKLITIKKHKNFHHLNIQYTNLKTTQLITKNINTKTIIIITIIHLVMDIKVTK